MTLQHFLSGLPAGQHWGPLLTSPLVPVLTVGQAREAFATIAGARPFAPTLIKEYVRDACENRS